MIPALVDGHLPPGRHPCTLEQLHDRFVAHDDFAASRTRSDRWVGLLRYLATWEDVHDLTGTCLLERVWIGGSFPSAELDPEDVDISPIINGAALRSIEGKPGSGRAQKLFESRKDVRRRYGVEPFAILRESFTTIMMKDLTSSEFEYLATRGLFDDFWLRRRASATKGPMTSGDSAPRRGYLEVDPWR